MNLIKGKELLILLPALLVALGGCSSSDPTEEENLGSFSVALSGGATATFTGDALISINPFVISLGHGTTQAIPMYFGSGATRPGVGTYQVVHGGGAADFRIAVYISPSESYRGVSGTVRILASSDSEITGDVSFSAEENNSSTPATIAVAGSFRAVFPQ
jgi:hypothetical protein